MDEVEKILKNKEIIVSELYDWAHTFDNELDEEREQSWDAYNYVKNLAIRLENGLCNTKDYEDILFHIGQINYNEEIIIL